MADAEENPPPEDENIEADIFIGPEADRVPENGNTIAEDENTDGNGYPEVEADQVSHENNPDEIGGGLEVEEAACCVDLALIAACGDGVPEAEADQVSTHTNPVEDDSSLNIVKAASNADLEFGGNEFLEVEADQLSPSKNLDGNLRLASVDGASSAPEAVGSDYADSDLKEYRTEDDQASPCDNPGLVDDAVLPEHLTAAGDDTDPDLRTEDDRGAVGVHITENVGQAADLKSEENLGSDFPADADLDSLVESEIPGDVACDNLDNSSTESGVKEDVDLACVEAGLDTEADSGDGLGQVELEAAAKGEEPLAAEGDVVQVLDVVHSEEGDNVATMSQAAGVGIDVSFEPECDQGPSDNSAHSSQIFCDEDFQVDEVRHEADLSEGLESDAIHNDLVINDADQPEDMIGACGGCDMDHIPKNYEASCSSDIRNGEEICDSLSDTLPVDQSREPTISCPELVPDVTNSECVKTESSRNISVYGEDVLPRNNLAVNSQSGESLLEIETANTESCTALNSHKESSDDLGLDQADVGIEHRRGSYDQNLVAQVDPGELDTVTSTGTPQELSDEGADSISGLVNNASSPVNTTTTSSHTSTPKVNNENSKSETSTPSDVNSQEISECDDQLLSELDAMLEDDSSVTGDSTQEIPNGSNPEPSATDLLELKELKAKYVALAEKVREQEVQIKSQQEDIRERDLKIEDMKKKEHETLRRQAAGADISKSGEDVYLAQTKALEYTIAQQQKEIKQVKDKLASHDQAAKRAISSLQNELKLRVDQVTKMYQDCLREKDQMVVKYAEAEQKNLELQKTIDKTESKVRDHVKDREVLIGKLKGFSQDKSKLSAQLQNKHAECNSVVKELDKYKDMISSQEVKVKWAQNKLRAELDSHKETKGKLEKTTIMLKQAKEETEQIRRNCQEMIKTYQTSEEIKSNSLDQQLKEKLTLLERQQQEHKDKEGVHQIVLQELDALKRKQKDAVEEIKTLRDKVLCLEAERQSQEHTLGNYQDILQNQKTVNRDTISRLQDLEKIEAEVEKTKEANRNLLHRLEEMQHVEKETQQEVGLCKNRETELMELTQKLTGKNAQLVSENTSLTTKLSAASADIEKLKSQCESQEKRISILTEELSEEKSMRHKEIEILTKRLDEKSKLVEELTMRIEEEKDENRTIKRRHTANIKDLTRQLQLARKKLETLEQTAGDKDSLSQGSRTSSTNSLDTINTNGQHSSGSGGSNSAATSRASSQEPSHQDVSETPTVRHIEPDKQMLIERIVKVQRNLARKSEKIEFVEDHNQQLLEDIKKKAKIIQHYILREEAGALAPDSMDEIKAQLSKKGGIMASVYNSHPVDGSMTLDLSLEINRKFQAVLEDTLLKNITLKENIETLGAEIARLSQENRTIQLKLKGHKS
ncbi:coiled-coil domain-containing protein 186-like isoform X2 [Lineus longissimus]|uniref:coiled-coil domain-containing protein 186-like isoform X2 n=1 Tax=Lineus longissimus TaxID=88925 RepID=UPI00315CD2CF